MIDGLDAQTIFIVAWVIVLSLVYLRFGKGT